MTKEDKKIGLYIILFWIVLIIPFWLTTEGTGVLILIPLITVAVISIIVYYLAVTIKDDD
ncbi:hypothetical protein [Pontibacillus marinus]|uniref:Uncharacterized protein n=1 Tax=Pontibacillus marinus BH030004 = DSM 16465 TaxID=1385511 RepID=A0A0A5GHY7_9BACI|nr:hypothetical protein [Pontibacillus marinus]KGX90833.1 hypothetical protein N783_18410 [Pontibacillus marinus BH030004 = DSM 16465]